MTDFFCRFTESAEEVTMKLIEKKVDLELEHERQVSNVPTQHIKILELKKKIIYTSSYIFINHRLIKV